MAYDLIKQIPTLVNDAVKESLGTVAGTTELDTTDVVSMGKNLISMGGTYEGFFKALANRIIKTVYFIRTYQGSNRNVLRDEHEYGAFIQKVYYEMPKAVENETYNIPDDNGDYKQKSPYDVQETVAVSSIIFGGKGTWSIEINRPVEQIKTAFTSAASMGAFISGIYTAVNNSLELEEERLVAAAVNTSMAQVLDRGKARNLLAEYNEKFTQSLTANEALTSADFLRFASKEINRTVKNMAKMSTAFNKAGYETFTTKDNLIVEILSEFSSASDTYLQSDTFHKELVALPNYDDIPFWQSSGVNFDFDSCSEINIAHDDLDGETIKQGGIIAFLRDKENVACYFGARRSWEMFNPRSEVMIHGEKEEKGYAVDDHANAVVFYLGTAGDVTLTGPAAHGTASASSLKAYRGNPIIVTVSPEDGYVVDEVTCGSADLTKVGDNKYMWSPVNDEDITITVTVKEQ